MLKVEVTEMENDKLSCKVLISASAKRTATEVEALLEAITEAGLYESIDVALDGYAKHLKAHKRK